MLSCNEEPFPTPLWDMTNSTSASRFSAAPTTSKAATAAAASHGSQDAVGGGGGGCGGGGGGLSYEQLGAHPPGSWACYNCSNINWPRRSLCNKCQAPRPIGTAPAGGQHPPAGGQYPPPGQYPAPGGEYPLPGLAQPPS